MLLFRHAHLVLTNLAVHPDALRSELLRVAKKDVQHNLKKLDQLNPRIKGRYEKFQEILSEREARRLAFLEAKESDIQGDAVKFQGALEPDNVHTLEAGDHKELAVQLAQDEMTRRARERKATRQAGISADEETRRRVGRVWDADDDHEDDDLSRRLREVRAQVERPGRATGQLRQRNDMEATYSYPDIPMNHTIQSLGPSGPSEPIKDSHDLRPPNIPPKSVLPSFFFNDTVTK